MKKVEEYNSVEELISGCFDKIKTIVDSSTVIGEKVVCADGTVILPVSKVSIGYVVGGGEYADLSARRVANKYPLSGGSAGGMSVTPVGFLIEKEGEVSFVNVENKSLYQTVLNMFNSILNEMQKDKVESDENK